MKRRRSRPPGVLADGFVFMVIAFFVFLLACGLEVVLR